VGLFRRKDNIGWNTRKSEEDWLTDERLKKQRRKAIERAAKGGEEKNVELSLAKSIFIEEFLTKTVGSRGRKIITGTGRNVKDDVDRYGGNDFAIAIPS